MAIEDDERFERYQLLQRYVGWNDSDVEHVKRLGPVLESAFDEIVGDFYDRIRRFPQAHQVIREGEPQIQRLMGTLRLWLRELFLGSYDCEYVARRWRIGLRHVEIKLDPSLVSAALSRLRSKLVERARQIAEQPGCSWAADAIPSLDRLLDLEAAIIEQAYREEFIRRDQVNQRMATLGQVAGGIAHELRNPLNVVKTSVYFLRNAKTVSSDKLFEHLGRIERQVDLANEVISAVTEFARVGSSERHAVRLDLLLPEWVENHCLGPGVERNLRLDEVPEIQGDPRQLQIAVGNIVRNACEAMAGKGTLTLTLQVVDRHIDLVIADRGHGMSPETLRRITEPWYSTKARGAGLGLAITKGILDRHGASLKIESELGQGSRFTIRFPLVEPEGGTPGEPLTG